MSIFSAPVSALQTNDIEELLVDQAVENVRLEFKREFPEKAEMLKKLSSFANTYGGYLVVGAEAGSDGRISGLPGVESKQGYKQTVVQWCSEGAAPPLTVEVSDPIPVSSSNGRVCYVISVAESDLTPHFLNGRKGIYVRTDEFSRRFEPHLATEQELRHLMERRRLILERRIALLRRTDERFQTFVKNLPPRNGEVGEAPRAISRVAIMPRYPSRHVSGHARLLELLKQTDRKSTRLNSSH